MERDYPLDEGYHVALDPYTAARPSLWAWVTVERTLYGVLFLAALAVRLAGLGRAPLLAEELSAAMAALRALQGARPGVTGYAPLLFNVQWLLFGLGSSAVAVRLLPALVGALFVGLPWLLRGSLGRVGALVIAAFLALSPGWVYAGRTADGALLSVALGAAALVLAWRFGCLGLPRDARATGLLLATALTAGAAVYTLLIAAALLLALWWWRAEEGPRALFGARMRAAGRAGAPALFFVALLAIASAFWLNPGGLGATVDLAGTWFAALGPGRTELPWYHSLRVLAIYEPLMLLLAGIGVYHGLRSWRALDRGLLLWLGYALLLGVALGQREPPWLVGILLPLTLLAGRGAQDLYATRVVPNRRDLVVMLVALVIMGYIYLHVTLYLRLLNVGTLLFAGYALGLVILGLVAYGVWVDTRGAGRIALLLAGLVLLIPTVRGTVALAHDRARDPWEPLLHRPSAAAMAELEPLVRMLSLQTVGDEFAADILYDEALGPRVAWALRRFPNARATVAVGAQPEATMLITGPRDEEAWPPGYAGRPLALTAWPTSEGETWHNRMWWLLTRREMPPAEQELLWIWVRMPNDG